jgi:hypothetical protein
LIFVLGKEAGIEQPVAIDVMRIDRCVTKDGVSIDEGAWLLYGENGTGPKLSKIVYGQVPEGFVEQETAKPLERPGCYVGTVGGTEDFGFRIDSAGRVVEMSPQELRNLYSLGDSVP